MKPITSPLLAGAILATMTLAVAAQSLPEGSFRVAAAGSCRGWSATCASRGGIPALCAGKYAECVQSGCWTEGPSYGNARHCGLKK